MKMQSREGWERYRGVCCCFPSVFLFPLSILRGDPLNLNTAISKPLYAPPNNAFYSVWWIPGMPATSVAPNWHFEHPKTIYSWKGACAWIPCIYKIPKIPQQLDNLTLYHNQTFNSTLKDYTGTILYEILDFQKGIPTGDNRVQFLGDNKSNCTFNIQNVTVQDSGVLGLRTRTSKDKWMEVINLNISERAPEPVIQLPAKIQEFQQTTLTCSLNVACWGYQLQWAPPDFLSSLKGHVMPSVSLTTSTISTENKLQFMPEWTHHGRTVTCQLIEGSMGPALSEAYVRLDVKHKPKVEVKVSPEGAIVTEGESVKMTCRVLSSNPAYSVLWWFKDGRQLRQQERARKPELLELSLSKVTKKDSGKYLCWASNDLGSGKEEEVNLQVHYAPEPSKVLIKPSPAKEKSPVTLTCVSQAVPPPTNYTWYHNQVEVAGVAKTLYIPSVLLSHAGNYSCVAENSLGPGYIGQEAQLDVQYPPKKVAVVIQSPTPIREGDSVSLFCSYNSSNPSVTRYEWNVPGSQQSSGVLKIQNVAWNVQPVTCVACNQWCSSSSSVNLDVHYVPRDVKVTVRSDFQEIRQGHRVVLSCGFSSSRPAEVHFSWSKDGGAFLPGGQELTFGAITPEDSGSYSCLVNNSVGQATSETKRLRVLYAPREVRVSIGPKEEVTEGKQALLTCESDADPAATQYAWFDPDGRDLQHREQTLWLDPVTVEHSGGYRCLAFNKLGRGISPTSNLTVYYSAKTIGRRVALGLGTCLALVLLAIWGHKLLQSWKKVQSQQGLQEPLSGQSFFVRKKKVRRSPPEESPQSLGCYNPMMEEATNYAVLHFPDTPRTGDAGASQAQGPSPSWDDAVVTYSVVQKRQVGDYENVPREVLEDEGIHYSELVRFGAGERAPAPQQVEYVTLKH